MIINNYLNSVRIITENVSIEVGKRVNISYTTISLKKETKEKLDELKVHRREPYDELLKRLVEESRETERKGIQEEAFNKYVEEIKKKAEEKIERIIVYGSYARGEETEKSDIDVLIVWKGNINRGRKTAAEAVTSVLIKYDVLISPKVISPQKYKEINKRETDFIKNVRKEGIRVV